MKLQVHVITTLKADLFYFNIEERYMYILYSGKAEYTLCRLTFPTYLIRWSVYSMICWCDGGGVEYISYFIRRRIFAAVKLTCRNKSLHYRFIRCIRTQNIMFIGCHSMIDKRTFLYRFLTAYFLHVHENVEVVTLVIFYKHACRLHIWHGCK